MSSMNKLIEMADPKDRWRYKLYKAMENPRCIVYKDHKVVIIKDKFRKSYCHYLALPLIPIEDMRHLTSEHIALLEHLREAVTWFTGQFTKNIKFRCGFHANPTMVQLHMHVISDDFRGPALKTAKHWNSYTTSFFVSLQKVITDLTNHGTVILPPPEVASQLLKAPLKCHKCGHMPVNMPSLKVHLLSHTPVN